MRSGYVARLEPAYDDDPQSGVVWQPDVYGDAGRVAMALLATRLIDVGCGEGTKLAGLSNQFGTIGIDFGPNVETARRHHPGLEWRSHDLMAPSALPITAEEATGSVIICADVIEHLPDPVALLAKLSAALTMAQVVLISTPERELWHGVSHMGPPPNVCHVREWSVREFDAMLGAFGFVERSIGLTRSNNHTDEPFTILGLLARSAETLAQAIPALIDRPIRKPRRHPFRMRVSRVIRILRDG